MESGTETAPLRERAFSGVRASSGRDLSRSLISSINSMGVIPQTASGENVLMRSATAPTSLPLMYTGLPLMPPGTTLPPAPRHREGRARHPYRFRQTLRSFPDLSPPPRHRRRPLRFL